MELQEHHRLEQVNTETFESTENLSAISAEGKANLEGSFKNSKCHATENLHASSHLD
jgi:hypothetical protein